MRFRYLYRLHRRRKITPRGHPVPDPVEIILQILLEILDRASVHPWCTLVGLDLLVCLLNLPLRNLKRLARRLQLVHPAPPGQTRLTEQTTVTDDPAPSLPLHYKGFITTTSRSASAPRIGTQTLTVPPLGSLPLATRTSRAALSGHAFTRSMRQPQIRLTSPPCRTPNGQ